MSKAKTAVARVAKPSTIHGVLVNPQPAYDDLLGAVKAVCEASGRWSDIHRRKAIRKCWRAMGAKLPVTIPIEIKYTKDDGRACIFLPPALAKEIRPYAPDGKEEGTKEIHQFITKLVREAWARRKAVAAGKAVAA